MEVLPANFAAFAQHKQFIVWQEVPDEKKAKPIKRPSSHVNGNFIDVTDAKTYTDYATAIESAKRLGDKFGVGFVLTPEDDFWFIDIDGCIDSSGKYNDISTEIYSQFNGAAFEVSTSGTGFHLFGRGAVPPHAKKNIALGLEFYTENRFVALTGTCATGTVDYTNDQSIKWLVETFFKPAAIKSDIEWSNTPHPLWRGPECDEELIAKFTKATTSKPCSIRDLWLCNIDVLAKQYPNYSDDNEPFDRSAADAALCLDLAWWTGGNCARIERLFNMSALVREKWHKREKYRRDTIENAVAMCNGWYGQDKAIKEQNAIAWSEPNETTKPTVEANVTLLSGARIVPFEERAKFFKDHIYLTFSGDVLCPDGVARNATNYNSCYAGYEFLEQVGGSKPIREPWKAYVTAVDVERTEAFRTVYRPELPYLKIIKIDGRKYVNIYRNTEIKSIDGDPTLFLDHIRKLYPVERDFWIIIYWLAAFLQHPGFKFRWSPFMQGVQGCGKSLISELLIKIIGEEHVHYLNPEDFAKTGGKFNSYMLKNRLVIMEEVSVADFQKIDGPLKRLIDHPLIEIQLKGVDQETMRSCANIILNSNFQDVIPITQDNRRIAPLFTKQQFAEDLVDDGLTPKYFIEINKWLDADGAGIMAKYLRELKIPDDMNPAIGAFQAPETSSKQKAIQESMPTLEKQVREIIANADPGTIGGWVSVGMLQKYLLDENVTIRSPIALTKTLQRMGYRTHPMLDNNKGRTNQGIANEGGKRVKLFIENRHPSLKTCLTGADVSTAYRIAQGYEQQKLEVVT